MTAGRPGVQGSWSFPLLAFAALRGVAGEGSTTPSPAPPPGTDVDPCLGINCHQGACKASGTTYSCECETGYEGDACDVEIDECDPNPCQNGASCVDAVAGYQCQCPWGFQGKDCEVGDYFTLQQWQGRECSGPPWRCFRLQLGSCGSTLTKDGKGSLSPQEYWWGKLTFDNDWRYTLDLCWTDEPIDDEERCSCEYHWVNVPKLGKNSLGPPTDGLEDSDQCHKLSKLTSSRLVNSTDMPDGLDCGGARGGYLAFSAALFALALTAHAAWAVA